MIELRPHLCWYNAGGGRQVERDNGQDMIWLVEVGIDARGREITVETHIGYCLRKPGYPINIFANYLSDSIRREVELVIAERNAKLAGTETVSEYGRQQVAEVHAVGDLPAKEQAE